MANIYKPELMEVIAVRQQTVDVKSVSLRFLDPERATRSRFKSASSASSRSSDSANRHLTSVRVRTGKTASSSASAKSAGLPKRCGRSKSATSSASAGPTATAIRGCVEGPRSDLSRRRNRHAADSLRHLVCLGKPRRFRRITVVYGARTVGDLVYVDELTEWAKHERVRVVTLRRSGRRDPRLEG